MPKAPSHHQQQHHSAGARDNTPYRSASAASSSSFASDFYHHHHQQQQQQQQQQHSPTAIDSFSSGPISLNKEPSTSSSKEGSRHVVSAACLACRAAKRRCDGVRPICTQCIQRGVTADSASESGGCQYVASKRGGPRYKGVRGAAALAKTEQRRAEKIALAAAKADQRTLSASSMLPEAAARHSTSSAAASPSSPPSPYSRNVGQTHPMDISNDGDVHMHYAAPPQHQQQQLPTAAMSSQSHHRSSYPAALPHQHTVPPHRQSANFLAPPLPPTSNMATSRPGPSAYHHHLHQPQSNLAMYPPVSAPRSWRSSGPLPAGSRRASGLAPVGLPRHSSLGTSATSSSSLGPAATGAAGVTKLSHPSISSTSPTSWTGPLAPRTDSASAGMGMGMNPNNANNNVGTTAGMGMGVGATLSGQLVSNFNPNTDPPALGVMPHHTAQISIPDIYADSVSLLGDHLSFANLEMWYKLQNYQLPAYSTAATHALAAAASVPVPVPGAGAGAVGAGVGVPHQAQTTAVPAVRVLRVDTTNLETHSAPSSAMYASSGRSPTMSSAGIESGSSPLAFEGHLQQQQQFQAQGQQHSLPSQHRQADDLSSSSSSASSSTVSAATAPAPPPPVHLMAPSQALNQQATQQQQQPQPTAAVVFADFISKLESLPKAGVVADEDEEDGHHYAGDDGTEGGHGRDRVQSFGGDDSGEEGLSGLGRGGRLRSTFDTERRVKALLTDYFQLAYPASPVLLSAEHLSSLTFHFCEGSSSALLAAVSASVAIHLNDVEAQKTLQEDAAVSLAQSLGKTLGGGSPDGGPGLTRLEVAAHHAASAEVSLSVIEEQLALASLPSSGSVSAAGTSPAGGTSTLHEPGYASASASASASPNSPGGPRTTGAGAGGGGGGNFRRSAPDLQLMLIECVATRVLLAQYYYGQCGHRGHRQGYLHALRAWEMAQSLNLSDPTQPRTGSGPPSVFGGVTELGRSRKSSGGGGGVHVSSVVPVPVSAGGGFTVAQKVEWGRRVFHACFSAAVVLATTGGFEPIESTQDVLTALQCRPSLTPDDAAWGTLIHGSHYVCRTYQALYDLESFRRGEGAFAVHSQAMAYAVRHEIFMRMSQLDVDMAHHCTYDPEWTAGAGRAGGSEGVGGDVSGGEEEGGGGGGGAHSFVVQVEKELAQSLKIAGKLMTAGSMIILHRAQAFGNARLFMDEPHCGLPAINVKDPPPPPSSTSFNEEEEALWHRSSHREGSPSESNAASSTTTATTTATASSYATSGGMASRRSSTMTHSTALSSLGHGSTSSSSAAHVPGKTPPSANMHPGTTISGPSLQGGAVGTAPAMSSGAAVLATVNTVPAKVFFPPDDRYTGGPFDAKLSLQRCKLAAAVMHETLVRLEASKDQEFASRVPEQRRRLNLMPAVGSSASSAGSSASSLAGHRFGSATSISSPYAAMSLTAAGGSSPGEALGTSDPFATAASPSTGDDEQSISTPRLPPYSACSYVLAAYVWLMLSLLALLGNDDRDEAAQQIEMLRSRARSIEWVLTRMSASWRNAREYRAEVETLLLANERLSG